MNRRQLLLALAAGAVLPRSVLAAAARVDTRVTSRAVIGAAWRGPDKSDPYFAGALVADWERRTLEIRYAVPLPTRPHGLLPEADGGLLVVGVRPGAWLLRCDGGGDITQQVDVAAESASVRLSGHLAVGGELLYSAEIDYRNDQGRIGVRDRRSLKKLDEWASGGIEPHQLLLDEAGHLMVANGGVLRTLADKKVDLQRMDSSLVRLDGKSGGQLGRWTLDDPRLSLRHIAWSHSSHSSHSPVDGKRRLGIAMQAEHDTAEQRRAAPILAVFDGETLRTPSRVNDGHGYAGDIAAAVNGGFALSSNKAGVAQLWQPGQPEKLTPIVELEQAYALADWPGPTPGGGVLVATAAGLVRWHPAAAAAFLPWPQPMALDNHWVLLNES